MAMKWTLAMVALCAAVTAVSCNVLPSPEGLLNDQPRLDKFLSCLQEKDTCEPWTDEVKRYIPSALKEGCNDCPPEHKHFYRVMTIHLRKNKPDLYKTLLHQFDKDGMYEKKLLEFIYGSD